MDTTLVLDHRTSWSSNQEPHRAHQLGMEEMSSGRRVIFVYTRRRDMQESAAWIAAQVDRYTKIFGVNLQTSLEVYELGRMGLVTVWAPGSSTGGEVGSRGRIDWRSISRVRIHSPDIRLKKLVATAKAAGSTICYDAIDFWGAIPAENRPFIDLNYEQELLRESDVVVAVSRYLIDAVAPFRDDAIVVPCGVSRVAALCARVHSSTNSRLGAVYAGSMSSVKIDWSQVYTFMRAFEEPVRFLGNSLGIDQIPDDTGGKLRTYATLCQASDSFSLLGWLDYEASLKVIAGSRLGLLPYLIHDGTLAMSPVKLFDYLACIGSVRSTVAYTIGTVTTHMHQNLGLPITIEPDVAGDAAAHATWLSSNSWKVRLDQVTTAEEGADHLG